MEKWFEPGHPLDSDDEDLKGQLLIESLDRNGDPFIYIETIMNGGFSKHTNA